MMAQQSHVRSSTFVAVHSMQSISKATKKSLYPLISHFVRSCPMVGVSNSWSGTTDPTF